MNLRHDIGNGRADIDHEVRQFDERHHEVEEVGVVGEVAVAHIPHFVQVGREDAGILEDSPVLNDIFLAFRYFHHLFKPFVQEVNLQVEGPSVHIGVEVLEIRVVVYGFEARLPAISFGEHSGECGFSASDVTGYCDVHSD